MKAIGYTGGLSLDHPGAFTNIEQPTPTPSGRDLLVKVDAISVNPIDSKVRARTTEPQQPAKVLGWDAAGVVAAVGDEVSAFKVGDQVYCAGDITRPGSNASHLLVDERIVGRRPESLSATAAAALPLTTITAWEALFARLRIRADDDRGKRLLIIGAAGGVGSIAIQLARQIAGLEVIATASRPETRDWCFGMGAHNVVDHRSDLAAEFRHQRLDAPDYILCCQHPDQHFRAMADLIAPQGTICSIVDFIEPQDFNVLKPKSAGFVWEFMFTRPLHHTADMGKQGELLNRVATLVDNGTLKTTLSDNLGPLSIDSLRSAHRRIDTGANIGKLVLEGITGSD